MSIVCIAALRPEDFSLDSLEIQKDPYAFYPVLREQAPVIEIDFFGQPNWVISRRADISKVLMNPAIFSSKTTPLASVLFADPPDHARLRRIVAGRFTRAAVGELAPVIARRTDELVAAIVAAGRCDIVEDFGARLTITMIAHLLGLDEARIEHLRALTKLSAEYVMSLRTGRSASAEAERANRTIHDLMGGVFQDRQFAEAGLVATLHEAWANGDLTFEEAVTFAVILFAAGHSTTTNLIGNAVHVLTGDPACLDRIAVEDGFVDRFVEEVLRMRPSFHRIQRITTCETELGGVMLPSGAMVRLLLASANRDPGFFAAPETFDADAERRGHLAFGQGIHTCLGNILARAEAGIALRAMARAVAAIRIAPDRPPIPLAGGTMNEFGFDHLHVILDVRS